MTPEAVKAKAIEILTTMLNREPTEQEIGNVMTDSTIVNMAIIQVMSGGL